MSPLSQINAKDTVRDRAAADASSGNSCSQGVASVVRSLTEGRLTPRPKEQEVLDVATDYFLKHGYQGASINAMARGSGISKESIYRYFSSKQQLFEAVIGRELVEYRRSLDELDSKLKTMDLRPALILVSESILSIITTDRTLALRRLIFDEATRSPEVGQHYYKIGPAQAYAVLENVFESHRHVSDFDVETLAGHFVALISWRVTIERSCAVRAAPTAAEITQVSTAVVDDFMKAFLRGS
jgi:TetR/AcrR family transcriptional regulator, mexJK operon transcriptional repressor